MTARNSEAEVERATAARNTPDVLIHAAIEALRALTAADLLTAIGTREIARRADVSTATLFHHFGSVEKFAAKVIARIYDPGTSPVESIDAKLRTLVETDTPRVAGLTLHHSEFERIIADDEHRLRVGLWAFGGDAAQDAYGNYMRVSDGRIGAAAEYVNHMWGRELRPPFDVASFISAHAALLSGAAIRHSADPAGIDGERFARAASALSLVIWRPEGDTRDFDDRMAEINFYPLRRLAAPAASSTTSTLGDVVLSVASRLFTLNGLEQVTVKQVARHSDVSPTTIYARFTNKEGLARACVLHDARVTFTADSSDPDWTAPFVSIATFLALRRNHLAPYLAALGTGSGATDDPLLTATGAAIASAQDAGHLRDVYDADELAVTVVSQLGSRLLGYPNEGVPGAVRYALHLLAV